MSPPELVDFFAGLFPAFRKQWNDEDNNTNRDGDDFTAHGVCAEFSAFYIEHALGAEPHALGGLFLRIEQTIASDPEDKDATAERLVYLLSGEHCAHASRRSKHPIHGA